LLIKFTLLWLRVFINIDDLPLLSDIVSFVVDLNVSVLGISVEVLVLNFKYLAFIIDNVATFISPNLPPSRVGSGTSDVCRSTVGLNIK
jgi:hypothetical protein